MSDLTQFNTLGSEMLPDISTYHLSGEECSVLVDPGPDRHVHRYKSELVRLVTPEKPLVVVILSPLPGCLSGLRLLRDLSTERILYLHWTVASSREASLGAWRVRPCSAPDHTVRLGPANRISLRRPFSFPLPGAMIGYHPRTRTLFTGPFFGSMGPGKRTDKPVLRRESVRIYTDVVIAGISAETVIDGFEGIPDFGQLAPAHGKLAVGGRKLIDTVFQPEQTECTPVIALHRLYIRIAALLGEETAANLFQASRIPRPDLELGFEGEVSDNAVSGLWLELVSSLTQWIGGPELEVLRGTLAGLSREASLPLPESFDGLLRQFSRVATYTGPHQTLQDTPDPSVRERASVRAAEPRADSVNNAETLYADLEAFRNTERAYALCLVSLDRIEQINRRFGRAGGDDALHVLAYHLENYRLSRGDQVHVRLYKLTGPDYVYLIVDPDDQDVVSVAEAIRKTVAESAMFLERITVSIGLVQSHELPTNSRAETFVERAQGRLSIARASGMNTICSSDPEDSAIGSGGATVLIADPEAPYLHTLTRLLEDKGFSVLLADDGADALDTIAQIRPDAIVCEAFLPKMNGFALREQLGSSSEISSIPFILISHRKDDETIEKAALLGITHFLRKPFSLVELLGLLSNLTRERL